MRTDHQSVWRCKHTATHLGFWQCIDHSALPCVSQATTSVRKGKKLVFFQLKVEAEWMAEAVDYDGNILARVEGELQLPDVDQENYNTDDLVVSGTSHLSACLLACLSHHAMDDASHPAWLGVRCEQMEVTTDDKDEDVQPLVVMHDCHCHC